MTSARSYLLWAIAIVAVIVVVVALVGRKDLSADRSASLDAARGPDAKDLPASAVLAINVSTPSVARSAARTPAPSSLSQDFERARSLKPLYDRLTSSGGASTGDAKFVLYRILATCAARTDNPSAPDRQRAVEKRRKTLADSIPDSNPDKQTRLRAFDELVTARCEGLEGLATTKADLDRLLDESARGGDPKARATLVMQEMDKSWPPQPPGGPVKQSGPTLTDSQLQTLHESIASRDPEAMVLAGTALSNSFRDLVGEVGPDHQALDGRASLEAWRLLACEYGLECGSSNRQVRYACAYDGHCSAGTLTDLVFFYWTTPYQSQLVDNYRGILRGIVESGDWSALQFARRPNETNSRFFFASPTWD